MKLSDIKKASSLFLMVVSFILTITFTSCDDKDNEVGNPPQSRNELVGRWQKYAVVQDDGSLSNGDPDEFWIFNADGSFQNEDGGEITTVGTYEVEGQILTINSHGVDDPNDKEDFRGDFEISGDQMTYSFEDLNYGDYTTIIFKKSN